MKKATALDFYYIFSADKAEIHEAQRYRKAIFMGTWHGAHLLERAVNYRFNANSGISSVISPLSELIVFLELGKAYEALVSAHQIDEVKE